MNFVQSLDIKIPHVIRKDGHPKGWDLTVIGLSSKQAKKGEDKLLKLNTSAKEQSKSNVITFYTEEVCRNDVMKKALD